MKKYKSYQEFVDDFLITAMQDGVVAVIVNYEDYTGLIQSLQEKTLNGNSLHLDWECAEAIDEDIALARMNDGNMMITVFPTAEMIGEAIIFHDAKAYEPMTYFIEKDAEGAMDYPLANKAQFEIDY